MLKNLMAKAKAAFSGTAPAWRGSSGETVAQRKARQERDGAQVISLPCTYGEFKRPGADDVPPLRERREWKGGTNSRESIREHFVSRMRKKFRLASGAIRFEPVGFRRTIRVRRNLRWGHTWIARKIAAANTFAKQAA